MRQFPGDYRNRFQMALQNLQANRRLRPVDVINGFKMVHPLRTLSPSSEAFSMAQLVLDLFTRMQVRYEPNAQPSATAPGKVAVPSATRGQPRVGLFVDAPDHLSGVCMTLSEWRQQARAAGRSLCVHACSSTTGERDLVAFPPMGTLSLNAYDGLSLPIPRMNEVLSYIQHMRFDVVHVSTPGPMGLLGLLAARQRGIPVCGTYHTDFPRYAATLTGDDRMEEVAWRFMKWFYGQLDRVAAPTETVRRELIARGIEDSRLHVVGRGVDTARFTPSLRDADWRASAGRGRSLTLLYVGRLSREKNLEVLARAFLRLTRTRPDIALVLVGDGPFRGELESMLHAAPAFFTGTLSGAELARAYASSDLFVFPSRTDTFGRVVLEAQASGLPVIVSDEGGPKDAMIDGRTGVVVNDINEDRLALAIDHLTNEPAIMVRYSRAARQYAATKSLEASFDAFWGLHAFAQDPANTSKVTL